jgi:hypothetical protein
VFVLGKFFSFILYGLHFSNSKIFGLALKKLVRDKQSSLFAPAFSEEETNYVSITSCANVENLLN